MAKQSRPRSLGSPDETSTDSADILDNMGEDVSASTLETPDQPMYRIYADSKIPVSRAVGKMWSIKHDAARTAYTHIYESWEEAFAYYNHNQVKGKDGTITPRGRFKRGNNVENIVYSNVNTVLPAIYSKNPDISVNVLSGGEEDFQKALQALLNRLIKMKASPGVNLKPKAKKAAMMAELTNLGCLKLDYIAKAQSRDIALEEMSKLKDQLIKVKTSKGAEEIYGKLQALESQMETLQPSGFKLNSCIPHMIIVDPAAEEQDGGDAEWMMEHTFLPTAYLNARFTEPGKNKDEKVYSYKPTHKASFDVDAGSKDDGLGIVLTAISGEANLPTSYTDQERLAYLYQYMTEVVFVWDKTTRRIFLFEAKDYTWPIWVWDDYMGTTRFFPYFFIQFSMSTGGMVSPGVTSYYLDQQDTVNQINKKLSELRTTYFDYWFYNSNVVNKDEIEKFTKALRGEISGDKRILGINAETGQKLDDLVHAIGAENVKEAMALFDKSDSYSAIDRLSATSDALRGTQFKANTTEDAVQAYVDATRIRIGAKIDNIEDCIADIALAMAEVCVQFFDMAQVSGLIGKELAKGWKNCSVEDLHSKYTVEIVAGSVEKPTSVFKKKEAIQVVQAIGQFANTAPGATLMIILRVLENAFTEVVIKPEDWQMMQAEIAQKTQMEQGNGAQNQQSNLNSQGIDKQALMNLPPQIKAQAMQMAQSGVPPEKIMQFLQQQLQQGAQSNGQGTNGANGGQQQPGPAGPGVQQYGIG